MFESAGFGRRGLSRSLGLQFCVDRCGARAARRGVADAAQVPVRTQDFARI
jgi:hypothetical protein